MAERPSTPGPSKLAMIWIGMPVVDVTGRLVGSAKFVKHSTPRATTVTDPRAADEDLDTAFARALMESEPQIGTELAERLLRNGYLKVSGAGPMDNDLYVLASQIAAVDDDTVRLSSPVEELVVERERWV
ncbi:MAG: hypothetical protein ACRD2A_19860 [Vicinamibacterales bacterium]